MPRTGNRTGASPGDSLNQLELALARGGFAHLPMKEDDIGAELLPILSKGLYTDPLHCLREYVQNSVDAEADQIRIKITGNSVIVHDNGQGMSLGELARARQFGLSPKNARDFVGFRGIGIYSGFDLCNRLLITTKREGDTWRYILEFDFGGMKRALETESGAGKPFPLTTLLTRFSRFSREEGAPGTHGTTVQLEEVSGFHINQLRNRDRLRAYILRNLPIDFDDKFEYRDQIVNRLKREVNGYRAVRVILESDAEPRETVMRPAIPHLDTPTLEPIKNASGDTIAFLWASLRKADKAGKRGRIPDEFADYRGLVYKVKGFTIGDNTKLQKHFKTGSSTLYSWYTGAIYVTDPNVIPNTERDDFESTPAYEALQSAVRKTLKGLEQKASRYQEEERASQKFRDHEERLKEIAQSVRKADYERMETFAEVDRILDNLKGQRLKLAEARKDWGKTVIKVAEDLRTRIRKDIDKKPKQRDKGRTARERAAATGENGDNGTSGTRGAAEGAQGGARKTLRDVIEDAELVLTEDALRVVAVIDDVLGAVLMEGSEIHGRVLAEIEESLNREFAN